MYHSERQAFRLSFFTASGSDLRALETEIKMFEKLQCDKSPKPHIVYMEGVLRTRNELLLVMEFVPYGTLLDLLRGARTNVSKLAM